MMLSSRASHARPTPSQEVSLRETVAVLQREVEAHGVGPCTVRITRRRGWPDPQPVTEVVVQAGEVALMTRHRDAQQAVFRAFQAVLDRIE